MSLYVLLFFKLIYRRPPPPSTHTPPSSSVDCYSGFLPIHPIWFSIRTHWCDLFFSLILIRHWWMCTWHSFCCARALSPQLSRWLYLYQHQGLVLLHVSHGILWRWRHVCRWDILNLVMSCETIASTSSYGTVHECYRKHYHNSCYTVRDTQET